ncbi:MAG: efflux RND transporter permease subunit [Bacteroidetes bacterium]|nr:MAG: efflux RND transporter permease subunit [Bacteroidota bacterium]
MHKKKLFLRLYVRTKPFSYCFVVCGLGGSWFCFVAFGGNRTQSVSRYDGGSITLYFDKHTDLNFRRFEVASLIRRTYPTLPKSLTYPQIKQGTERKRQALPLLSYSINAPYTPTQIKQTIENQLQKQLLLIEGISQVEVRGATDRQVAIAYNAEKLAQYQLSPQDIEQTIRQYNTQTHLGGHLTPAGERLYFKTDQTIKNLQDLRSLALRTLESETGSRQVIRLQEVAEVYWEEQRIMQHFRINGQNAITLNLYAHEGANQLDLVAMVQHKLEALQQALPAGFQLLLEHNDTEHIQTELQKIYYRSGLSMLILLGHLWLGAYVAFVFVGRAYAFVWFGDGQCYHDACAFAPIPQHKNLAGFVGCYALHSGRAFACIWLT